MDSSGGVLFLVFVAIFFYFLPFIAGFNHRHSTAIFLLNLFLGWTIVGWVIALVWAYTDGKPDVVVVRDNNQNQNTSKENKSKSVGEELKLLLELRESGVLTKEEFEEQKMKLLKS